MLRSEKEILSRFVAGEHCRAEELAQLNRWLGEKSSQSEIRELFETEWEENIEKETLVRFQDIHEKIISYESGKKNLKNLVYRKIISSYQKVAAILLIPGLLFSVLYFTEKLNAEDQYFETCAARGQKSYLILPDGTSVWLNSDTQIKYSSQFGKSTRRVIINGEALFKVTKNEKKPFVVQTGSTEIEVLGTTFNVMAYPDEDEIETSLLEGKIKLTASGDGKQGLTETMEMKPGQTLKYSKSKKLFWFASFDDAEITGWKNNRLIFRNDSFENLIKKMERWFNVKVIYEEPELEEQRLTVELYQGEQLDRLLEIIELALRVECKIDGNIVYIKTK